MTDSNLEPVKEENIVECRACLQEINSDSTYYNLFDCVGQQEQMGSTIAEKLSNIAHIEISDADELPKVICDMCCTLLQSAHSFAVTVRKTDELLRQKFANVQKESEIVWPKPIQISNNIDTHYIPHAEIKEEVLSEDECFAKQDSDEHNISKVEIKVESNLQDRELNIPIDNEECRLDNMQIEYLESVNDESVEPKENTAIKEEPISDEEMESVESLDCMLCTKTFNSVSGLKAHVITQHSYKGVKRKSNNTVSPKKVKYTYVCEICKRAFATSTDLMVHETCHDKCKCYLCHKSFPTFRDLSQHRLTCCESKTPETYLQKPESSKDAPKPTKPTTDALKPRTTELTNSRTTETTKQKKFTKYSPKPKITTEASESSDTDTSEPTKYVYSQKRKSTKEAPISPNTTELTIPNNTMESQLQISSQVISRRHRVSYNQLESLWEILDSHRDIAVGFNKSAQAREYSKRMWTMVAERLNSMGKGATKDWKGWSQYWIDLKAKLKKKAARIRATQNRTGGGPPHRRWSEAPLTDVGKKFLSLLGKDYGSGLPNTQVDPFPDLTQFEHDVPAPAQVPTPELSPVLQVHVLSPEPAQVAESEPAPAPASRRRHSRRQPMSQQMAREALVNISRNRLLVAQSKVEHLGTIAQNLNR